MRVWDVKMPPAKKTMVHGMLVPTVTGAFGLNAKKRRIAIEIHSNDSLDASMISPNLLLDPHHEHDSLHSGDKVIVRILKPSSKGDAAPDESSEEDDHQTVSTLGFHATDEESAGCWVTRYVLGLDDVEILKTKGSHCEIKMGHGSDTQVRHITFVNENEGACVVLVDLCVFSCFVHLLIFSLYLSLFFRSHFLSTST